jgi:U4/U6 small nuclear ribonucleoprotein PRP3
MEPPPPKVKLSNFMNVLKDKAVADPTQVEMEVRQAIQDRLEAHLERNAKKKLTKEQKAEKFMRKLKRDSALECRAAIFTVDDLSNGAHRFKVDMNAQQMALNGVCIIPDKKFGLNIPAVILVEGGPRAINFYKKLMLRRIKWNTNPKRTGEKEEDGETVEESTERTPTTTNNQCKLVWEVSIP